MATLTKINRQLVERIKSLEDQIGNTPLVALPRLSPKPKVQIFAKLEWLQLGGSIKARPAFNIIKQAVLAGELDGKRRLLDATSGNTGIAYAHIAAALGIPLTIFLPKNASKERKVILKSLGAELIYTTPFGGTDVAQQEALALYQKESDLYYYADQYGNPNNWKAHTNGTAQEIWKQSEGKISHFVAGLGTTGTFVGTTRGLKALQPKLKSIALQPKIAMHGLEGWKHLETAKVPTIYDEKVADQIQEISTLQAYDWVKKVARQEGLLISPSAGANMAGAVQIAQEIDEGYIVTVFADSADKYGDVMEQIFKN